MKTLQDYILEQVANKNLTAEKAMQLLNELKLLSPSACTQSSQEYAIIGMACRFPQANTTAEFWKNLIQKKDTIGSFPKNRIQDVKCANQQTFEMFQGLNCRVGSYLDRIDLFDHTFFGLTPAETRVMDPQQRLFLETAVEALEDAGLTQEELKESKTGVYVGFSINDDNYIDILAKDDPNVALGNQPSVLAYRLSFLYDLRGPTMIIDTACSSSLTAVHQACQAIATGDCEQAIVGGVNLRLFPAIREINNLGIEAYDGRCKSFDEKANGTNIGDGVAAIIIKRKDLAERDGDFIHAVIKGSAVNSDGGSNGITAPNPEAQAAVIKEAWNRAGIDPEKLNFIETHGTGTKLGDPIEILGISHAFAEYTKKKQFCALGAVKTNIGHLEATAGLAGLIKTVLCLKHRQLPATLHFNRPNPFIDFANSPVYVNAELKTWEPSDEKLLAGVSSFGISGTNCHVVVEEYPFVKTKETPDKSHLFYVSAKNEESLKELLLKYSDYLKHPFYTLADISKSSAVSRNHEAYRLVFVADSLSDLQKKIDVCLSSWENRDKLQSSAIFSHHLTPNHTWSPIPNLYHEYRDAVSLYFTDRMNWKSLYDARQPGRKVPLPTYAFLPKRHWPHLEVEMEDLDTRIESVCYGMKWIEEEHSPSLMQKKEGQYIFFIQEIAAHEAFFDLAKKKGVQGIKVYQGKEFKKVSDQIFIMNPQEKSHYDQLIENISSLGVVSGVVHMWDCMPIGKVFDSYEGIVDSQIGMISSFHLIRAFQRRYNDPAINFVNVTAYAYQIQNNDMIDPSRMPALGVNKVISQEFPKTVSFAVDCDVSRYNEAIGNALFAEIFDRNDSKDAFVILRHGKRFVQVIDRLDINETKERAPLVREHGVYVIGGGTGYLGMQTALLLSQKARVKIALLSRRPASALTEKHHQQFAEIHRRGSEVIFVQTDITDKESCSQAIQDINKQYGAIHGIFIANKNISHLRLDEVSYDFFTSNIFSKLKAVWLLDHLTAAQKPDFIATFSSISSLTGGPTGGDCCASNLFLDSYGDYRNAQGNTTITMNYTLIEADDGSLLSDRLSMIPPLTKEEFVHTLDLFLKKELNFAVIADFDPYVMTKVLPFMKLRFSQKLLEEFAQASQPNKIEVAVKSLTSKKEGNLSAEDTLDTMKRIWMDVLGYTEIKDDANFFDIGGDSISAVKLLHLAKVQLQVDLNVSDLYSYPIVQDLCRYVHKKLYGEKPADRSIKSILEDLDTGNVELEEALNLLK